MARTVPKTIKRGALCLALALFVFGLIPIRYLAAPQWDVWVKDEAGKPLAGLNVRLDYENYSAESDSHEITLVTDQSGRVTFPSQYGKASLIQRAFYTSASAVGGAHASFGNHAFVFVFGNGFEGDAVTGTHITDWAGSPNEMASSIVARSMKSQH